MNETTTGSPRPEPDDLARVAPRLLDLSIDSAASFVRDASELLRPVLPTTSLAEAARAATSMMRPRGMCDIPETDCPPRCVCNIRWELLHGETATCTIRVTNTGTQSRTFQLSATGLSGPGDAGSVTVSPTSFGLQPGESAVATVSYTAAESVPAGSYSGEVLIRGAYEQCARIRLTVRDRHARRCHCEIEQGDPPRRIRAHRWYHHFQCEEPCFPPVRPVPQPTPDQPTPIPQ